MPSRTRDYYRLANAMQLMTPGTMGGQSRVATMPAPYYSQLPSRALPPVVPPVDPDFRTASEPSFPQDPAYLVTMTDIPDGAAGDALVLWMVCDMNDENNLAVSSSIEQYDSGAGLVGTLTVVAEAEQSNGAATIITAVGVRGADLAAVNVNFSVGSGPFALALGTFPPGMYSLVIEENYPYSELLATSISAPGYGVFAGMMVSDLNPGVGVTFQGTGESVTATAESEDYKMVVWSYRSTVSDADFDLTGDWITYANTLALGPP